MAAEIANAVQLQKHVAEMALRLMALPVDGQAVDPALLYEVELLASRVLREVENLRSMRTRPLAESSGCWRAFAR